MSQGDQLVTALNMAEHDDFYADLLNAHDGLSDEESQAFNARLILILANHIGNPDVLKQALLAAR
ncbi:DUF2783 domain-containing protein [Anderseniella sp. Alg231-50]|uniref:DUF2783 domain-containing protein n=1 Tax=Anderseniella sp. Alg231-50 TaxID=1922226 RepID=UPI000D55440C